MQQLLEQDGPVRREHDPDLEAAAEPRGFLQKTFVPPEEVFLPSDAARSDRPPATANIAMHVTGAFVEPTHEIAFAAWQFRLAFRGHVLLMTLPLALLIVTSLSRPPDVMTLELVLLSALPAFLGLVGRVLVHRMHDTVRAQRMGSWTWTAMALVPMSIAVCLYATTPTAICKSVATSSTHLPWDLAFALVNGSHGLSFAHKLGLIGALLLVNLSAVGACGVSVMGPRAGLASAAAIVGFVGTHLAEMQLRQVYADKVQDKLRQEEETTASRRLEERNEQLRAEKERLMYDNELQRRGRPLDDGDDRSAIRRGLQAGFSQPYHRAASTDSSERGAPAPTDSPPASMPPGPPSSSDRKSSESGKSGQGTGNFSGAVQGKSTAPPPTWAELDAQFYAETAAELAAEQGMPFGAPSSTAGAPSSQAGQSKALPPPSWAELAYRRFYAERAARSTTEPGVPPPMGQPPTWAELGAEPGGQWHDERAPVVALPASSAPATEATSGQEVVEEMVTEMATQEKGAASAGTVCIVHRPDLYTAQQP